MGKDKKAKKKDKKKSREDKVKLAAAKGVVEEVAAKNAALKSAAKAEAKAVVAAAAEAAKVATTKAAKAAKSDSPSPADFERALRVGPDFVLADLDPESHPGFDGDRAAGEAMMAGLAEQVADLQERLYADSKAGGKRSVLLVVQGMDTSGKGGIMRHVVGAVDPQGVDITAFKAPTAEEREHPFLWRIERALPTPGVVGVFDRSQYEDVLIVRVHDLVPRAQWARRYAQINAFEKRAAAAGITIVKVMLHISKDEQKARLAERLANPEKYWKFNPGDIDERGHWDAYMEAYQAALDKCSTEVAPWYVVPANAKWYARLAVMNLLLDALTRLDPQWPAAEFDVAEQQARLAES
jgi:PPK2 family polyphosphate:nucleotide phosphotransferase